MAKGKKTGGRDFVKGVCANRNGPWGKNPPDDETKELLKQKRLEYPAKMAELLSKSSDDIQRICSTYYKRKSDPDYIDEKVGEIDAFQSFVAAIIIGGIERGDHKRLQFLLDRIIGKVKDKVEHSGKISSIQERPTEELQAELEAIRAKRNKCK